MRFIFMYFFLVCISNILNAQKRQVIYEGTPPVIETIYFSGNGFRGVIFPKEFSLVQKVIPNYKNSLRYTPTVQEVLYVDSLAFLYVKKKNEESLKKYGGYEQQGGNQCPIIHENWNNFIRQVIGYKDENGDEMILINCFWKELAEEEHFYWLEEFVFIQGGCSDYWQIFYNKTKGEIVRWSIN